MRAVVQDRYGPPEVLRIEDVPTPAPNDDEILIRIRATTVGQTDVHLRAARPFVWRFITGLRRPKRRTLGVEMAGVVEAVGAAVREFKVGDAVFGAPRGGWGTAAEYICLRESDPVALKPEGMSFEDAAAVPEGAFEALGALRSAKVQAGQRIVIYGGSGSMGTAAVQLARHMGVHVTAVCSAKNVGLVRSLGAVEVIDYRAEDFTRNGQTYDAIIDAVGKYAFRWARRSLRPGGTFVPSDLGPHGLETVGLLILTRWGDKRIRGAIGRRSKADVVFLKELIEAGAFRAVVDRVYSIEQVADAHRYVEMGHKVGNVVLDISP